MEAVRIILSHDVEEKGVSIVVECLVVKKQLCQQAQVLGIGLRRAREGHIMYMYR